MTIKQREFKIVFSLIGFYIFLLIGLTTPLVLAFYEFNGLGMQYKIIAPAISVIFVSWFHNSASDLLRNTASFAIPGVYELRQKYLPHVNRIKRVWLWLAIWAVIFQHYKTHNKALKLWTQQAAPLSLALNLNRES